MEYQLDQADINEIKHLKKMGIVFPVLFFTGLALFDFVYWKIDTEVEQWMFITINISVLLLSVLVNFLMNRKYNKDLLLGTKNVELAIVQEKYDIISHEAGSGTLYIGQRMRPIHVAYVIIDYTRYEVPRDVYDLISEGDEIEMHYSAYSKTLLSIHAKTN